MGGRFLTAEWRKLVMANYEIDPSLLKPYLPGKTELDNWKNSFYVSLVGFMFKDVRVKGLRIPYHIDFPEVNLRFYVRYKEGNKWKRGVVFIREIVPKPAISFVANILFRERYITLPMKYCWESEDNLLRVSYSWKKYGLWNKLEVVSEATSEALMNESMEEFITEHFWGYSRMKGSLTGEYKVEHPRWDIYKIKEYSVDCDFGRLYGDEFRDLQNQPPTSVFMAEGSPIQVFHKRTL